MGHGHRAASSVVAACTLAVALAGCGGLVPGGDEVVVVTSTVTTVTPGPGVQGGVSDVEAPVPPGGPDGSGTPAGARGGDLDEVVAAAAGYSGIAVSPVGGREPVEVAGSWTTGVAWSTIKVPLALAVARSAPGDLEAATTAITVSDNAAAESLWGALGGGEAAAASVGAVLAEGGDTTSQVPAVRTRPGYSIFGQTTWSITDQARFGSRLPCLGTSERVLDLMGQVSPDQRWGLGRIPGARFKGGWGPGVNGGYLVRQFGIVPGAGGDLAVAIATDAPSFGAGTTTLSGIADALAPKLSAIPGGTC
jgi:hypothetical protein